MYWYHKNFTNGTNHDMDVPAACSTSGATQVFDLHARRNIQYMENLLY